MNNLEKYIKVYVDLFGIPADQVGDSLTALTVEKWDSVAQMNLAAALEEAFDIFLDPEDVIELVSYAKGKAVLQKHGIEF